MQCPRCNTIVEDYCSGCEIYAQDFERKLQALRRTIMGYVHNMTTTDKIMKEVQKVIKLE